MSADVPRDEGTRADVTAGARGLPDAAVFQAIDAATDEQRAASVMALDGLAQQPAIIRLHAWVLEQLQPQPGMQVLDVGCGLGDDARGLAVAVGPTGSVTGVDPSETMLGEARRRAEAARNPARFVQGSAERLPAPDSSVDLVRCERVLQHLRDPAVAVAEMRRVLRPGGRVGLIDTDWRSLAVWPGQEHILSAWHDGAAVPTPSAGAQLIALVLDHGFADPQVIAETLMLRPRRVDAPPVSLILEEAERLAAAAGDGEAWRRRLDESAARGSFVFSVTMYAVAATRA